MNDTTVLKKLLWNMSYTDRKRLMQCVFCYHDLTICDKTEADEDEDGLCRYYTGLLSMEENEIK